MHPRQRTLAAKCWPASGLIYHPAVGARVFILSSVPTKHRSHRLQRRRLHLWTHRVDQPLRSSRSRRPKDKCLRSADFSMTPCGVPTWPGRRPEPARAGMRDDFSSQAGEKSDLVSADSKLPKTCDGYDPVLRSQHRKGPSLNGHYNWSRPGSL